MKVIFIKDLKKQGKVNEIKEEIRNDKKQDVIVKNENLAYSVSVLLSEIE